MRKRKFLSTKMVEVRCAEEVSKDFSIHGVETLEVGRSGVKLKFDTAQTPLEAVMSHISEAADSVDITISDPALVQLIAKIYERVREEKTWINNSGSIFATINTHFQRDIQPPN